MSQQIQSSYVHQWATGLYPDLIQWRHNDCNGVWNHQRLDCLLNCLFRCRSKETSKLRVTGLGEANPLLTIGFPSQRASYCPILTLRYKQSIKHVSGAANVVPDTLSRHPIKNADKPDDLEDSIHASIAYIATTVMRYTPPRPWLGITFLKLHVQTPHYRNSQMSLPLVFLTTGPTCPQTSCHIGMCQV